MEALKQINGKEVNSDNTESRSNTEIPSITKIINKTSDTTKIVQFSNKTKVSTSTINSVTTTSAIPAFQNPTVTSDSIDLSTTTTSLLISESSTTTLLISETQKVDLMVASNNNNPNTKTEAMAPMSVNIIDQNETGNNFFRNTPAIISIISALILAVIIFLLYKIRKKKQLNFNKRTFGNFNDENKKLASVIGNPFKGQKITEPSALYSLKDSNQYYMYDASIARMEGRTSKGLLPTSINKIDSTNYNFEVIIEQDRFPSVLSNTSSNFWGNFRRDDVRDTNQSDSTFLTLSNDGSSVAIPSLIQ
ncbi:hypothetical protein HDU92_002399 [Lobulomyces angularis]|nr:hypothetical protein HDU92_002399 [Lobulomyces angularis]